MRVLLLSHNHTVQEMVALALREMEEVELVVAHAADQVEPTTYDLIFVDDALPLYQESVALAQTLGVEGIVLLAQGNNTEAEHFTQVLRKPFLPSELRERVEEEQQAEVNRPEETVWPENRKKQTKKHNKKKNRKAKDQTKVLDLDEIETIKALLEEEGLEIVNEEELAEKVIAEKTPPADQQAALMRALRTMKPKKIRKLLRGATVRVEITFPERR